MFEDRLLKYRVKEILSANILKVKPDVSLAEVLDSMLLQNVSDALITDKHNSSEKILGIITFTDISRFKKSHCNFNLPVSNYMQKNVIMVHSDELITTARQKLIVNKIGRLPVYEDGKILGIIRTENILNSYYMKLETINRQYKHIIDHMHEAVTVIDASGNVLIWNKSAEKIYGIKAENLLFQKLVDFFPNALSLSVLEGKIPIENIYHSPKPNYHVIISALPIYIDGEFVGVVATERDVTEYRNLSTKLENANLEINLLKEEVEKITKGSFSLGQILGKNPKIQQKIQLAKHISQTDTSVLITGESGTGKEIFARAIHQNSGRQGHFVPVNCSAVPNTLFESEFFGYVGGAFTGALKKGKMGLFELANHGTLFLDEIGDLPIEAQAKLLRVLQEGKVRRIGSEKFIEIDVRIISATNKDIKEMVNKGTFREDLYYRLNVVEINLPPLRERKEDIILMFNYFLEEICSKNNIQITYVDKEVFNVLLKYKWKGNIRELKNTVEYMVVLSRDGKITKDSIPQYIIEDSLNILNRQTEFWDLEKNVKQIEMEMIQNALEKANGNKAYAAKILNIPRSTLYYKLKLYELE